MQEQYKAVTERAEQAKQFKEEFRGFEFYPPPLCLHTRAFTIYVRVIDLYKLCYIIIECGLIQFL